MKVYSEIFLENQTMPGPLDGHLGTTIPLQRELTITGTMITMSTIIHLMDDCKVPCRSNCVIKMSDPRKL